jgi:uncharacterized DUF497 family protein
MILEWDEAKRLSNLRKHGIDFRNAAEVLAGFTYTVADDRRAISEQRYCSLGLLGAFVVVVIHAERGDAIRVISMRRARKHETEIYFAQI